MTKSISLAAAVAAALTSGVAMAELTGNAAITNNYIWRGITQTNDQAAGQGGSLNGKSTEESCAISAATRLNSSSILLVSGTQRLYTAKLQTTIIPSIPNSRILAMQR